MMKVALTHDDHIIDYGTHDMQHHVNSHAGARILTFETQPNGLRVGNFFDTATNTVHRPRDNHTPRHESQHWEESVIWAIREKRNAIDAMAMEIDDGKRNVAKVFGGLIYNVLLAASDIRNRVSLDRWNKLSDSMVSWVEFGKHVTVNEAVVFAPPVTQPSNITINLSLLTVSNISSFLDEENVYVYDPVVKNVVKMRGTGVTTVAADAPYAAHDSKHYEVRNVLGYAQDPAVSLGSLRAMGLADRNGVIVSDLTPVFGSTIYSYVASTTMPYVYVIATPLARHTKVTGLNFGARGSNAYYEAVLNLDLGVNTVVLTSESQDGSDIRTYTIAITRTA